MAFTPDLPAAAYRNLQAAEVLESSHRKDVAGYLYGLAAECALKQMVIPLALPKDVKDTILYLHFPELRTQLRDALKGRNARPLSTFVFDDAFMNNWNIKMRYADARQILDEWVKAWKQQAKDAVNAMGT